MYQEVVVPAVAAGVLGQILCSPGLSGLFSQPAVRWVRSDRAMRLVGVGATGARQVRRHLPEIDRLLSPGALQQAEAGNCIMAPCRLSREYLIASLMIPISNAHSRDGFLALSVQEQGAHLERMIAAGWRKQLEFLAADTGQAYYQHMLVRNFEESTPDIRVSAGFDAVADGNAVVVRRIHLLVNRRLSGPWFAGVGGESGHGLCEPFEAA